MEQYNKNNFAKYSEDSKHQIEKLEGENKELKENNKELKINNKELEKKNKELEKKIKNLQFPQNQNIIHIKFYDEKNKREYTVEINNKVVIFDELKNLLYEKYPKLKGENINIFTIEGKNIDMISETEYNSETRIIIQK